MSNLASRTSILLGQGLGLRGGLYSGLGLMDMIIATLALKTETLTWTLGECFHSGIFVGRSPIETTARRCCTTSPNHAARQGYLNINLHSIICEQTPRYLMPQSDGAPQVLKRNIFLPKASLIFPLHSTQLHPPQSLNALLSGRYFEDVALNSMTL